MAYCYRCKYWWKNMDRYDWICLLGKKINRMTGANEALQTIMDELDKLVDNIDTKLANNDWIEDDKDGIYSAI